MQRVVLHCTTLHCILTPALCAPVHCGVLAPWCGRTSEVIKAWVGITAIDETALYWTYCYKLNLDIIHGARRHCFVRLSTECFCFTVELAMLFGTVIYYFFLGYCFNKTLIKTSVLKRKEHHSEKKIKKKKNLYDTQDQIQNRDRQAQAVCGGGTKKWHSFLDPLYPAQCLVTSCWEVNFRLNRFPQKVVPFFWILHVWIHLYYPVVYKLNSVLVALPKKWLLFVGPYMSRSVWSNQL